MWQRQAEVDDRGFRTNDRGAIYTDEQQYRLYQYVLDAVGRRKTAAKTAKVDPEEKANQLRAELSRQKWWQAKYDTRLAQEGDILRTTDYFSFPASYIKDEYLPEDLKPNASGLETKLRLQPGVLLRIDSVDSYLVDFASPLFVEVPDDEEGMKSIKLPVEAQDGLDNFLSRAIDYRQFTSVEIAKRAEPMPDDAPTNLDVFDREVLSKFADDARAIRLFKWMAKTFREAWNCYTDPDGLARGIVSTLPFVEWDRRWGDAQTDTLDFKGGNFTLQQLRAWANSLAELGLDPETNEIHWEAEPIWSKAGYSIAPLRAGDEGYEHYESDWNRHGSYLDQCIVNDDQPYMAMEDEGLWEHYALRDKTGRPCATICMHKQGGNHKGAKWGVIENRGRGNSDLRQGRGEGRSKAYSDAITKWLDEAAEYGIDVDRSTENTTYAPQNPRYGLDALGVHFEAGYGLVEPEEITEDPEEFDVSDVDDLDRVQDLLEGEVAQTMHGDLRLFETRQNGYEAGGDPHSTYILPPCELDEGDALIANLAYEWEQELNYGSDFDPTAIMMRLSQYTALRIYQGRGQVMNWGDYTRLKSQFAQAGRGGAEEWGEDPNEDEWHRVFHHDNAAYSQSSRDSYHEQATMLPSSSAYEAPALAQQIADMIDHVVFMLKTGFSQWWQKMPGVESPASEGTFDMEQFYYWLWGTYEGLMSKQRSDEKIKYEQLRQDAPDNNQMAIVPTFEDQRDCPNLSPRDQRGAEWARSRVDNTLNGWTVAHIVKQASGEVCRHCGLPAKIVMQFPDGDVPVCSRHERYEIDARRKVEPHAGYRRVRALEQSPSWRLAMPYQNNVWYHVTHRDNLQSIRDHGLVPTNRGMGNDKNWDDYSIVTGGIYLHPTISAAEGMHRVRCDFNPLTRSTGWDVDELVTLQITGIDQRRLHPDPEIMTGLWEDAFDVYQNDLDSYDKYGYPIALEAWFENVGDPMLLDRSGEVAWDAYWALKPKQREWVKDVYANSPDAAWVYLGTIPAQSISLAHPKNDWEEANENRIDEFGSTFMDDHDDYAADQYNYKPLMGSLETWRLAMPPSGNPHRPAVSGATGEYIALTAMSLNPEALAKYPRQATTAQVEHMLSQWMNGSCTDVIPDDAVLTLQVVPLSAIRGAGVQPNSQWSGEDWDFEWAVDNGYEEHEADDYYRELERATREGGDVPPLVLVAQGDGTYESEDGWHRASIARHLGLTEFPAYVYDPRARQSNYGPNGAANVRANQADTVYADQKAAILPDWAVDPDLHRRGH